MLNIVLLSIIKISVVLIVIPDSHDAECHSSLGHYTDCPSLNDFMLNDIILSFIMAIGILLSVISLNVVAPSKQHVPLNCK
jgi:hypothetical protein